MSNKKWCDVAKVRLNTFTLEIKAFFQIKKTFQHSKMRYISLWNDISISNSNINNKYALYVCNKYISHFLAKNFLN